MTWETALNIECWQLEHHGGPSPAQVHSNCVGTLWGLSSCWSDNYKLQLRKQKNVSPRDQTSVTDFFSPPFVFFVREIVTLFKGNVIVHPGLHHRLTLPTCPVQSTVAHVTACRVDTNATNNKSATAYSSLFGPRLHTAS
jgi:hypothetical protein